MDSITPTILAFLKQIGLPCAEVEGLGDTFLPGVTVRDGVLSYDPARLLYPGDLLHEAGHLVILTPTERQHQAADFGPDGGYEMGALAWSYAACLHLELPVEVLFHPDGYKGDSETLIENFSQARYIGVPILEWKGMASTTEEPVYPRMRHWLCQESLDSTAQEPSEDGN